MSSDSSQSIGDAGGKDALDLAAREISDLMVTDLDLPGIDGDDLIRCLYSRVV